jgi:hypothetical protein
MMLRICRAKARRYIPSLRVGFCSAALQGGIGCKQCRHTERVWNLLDEGSAFGFAGVQPSHSGGGIWFCPYGCPILRVLCEGWERPL